MNKLLLALGLVGLIGCNTALDQCIKFCESRGEIIKDLEYKERTVICKCEAKK